MKHPKQVWLVSVDHTFLVFMTLNHAEKYIELVAGSRADYSILGPFVYTPQKPKKDPK